MECLDELETVLDACARLDSSSGLSELDKVVLGLKSVCAYLGSLDPGHQDAADINELHSYLCQLCLEYETKLLFLLSSNPSHPISSLSFGRRGRPRKVINLPLIELLREMRYTWMSIAEVLMISRTTLWRNLRDLNIVPLTSYTEITDTELDAIMSLLVSRFPQNGIVMMWGHLKSINIYVTRQRVAESLARIAPEFLHYRQSNPVTRRVYNVPAPNYLWHIDGLHCLIRWKVVIHGGIDGYSRRIVYLRASDNNRALTVYGLFCRAVSECGWPSRVRSDKGGENVDVANSMLRMRGTDRQSFITGSSVHNQRIERLWRDTFRCVGHLYYALFYEMEDCGLLNIDDEWDLFALHFVFLPRINSQLIQFMRAWNRHPLRTEGGLSPLQLWSRGLLSSSTEWQMEICTGLSVSPDVYGIEPNTESNSACFENERVIVQPFNINLNTQQLQFLRENFDPLQSSNENGVDIYTAVRLCVGAL